MRPLSLRLRNFRSFAELDLDLPDGCCAIVGQVVGSGTTDSNGAGKSTVVNAIDFALFGRDESTSWEDYVTADSVGGLMVELTFEHRGELFRVRRGFNGKATLDLEKYEGDVYYPLTSDSTKATQELLEERLGFTRTTFRASSFLRQRDSAAFTSAKKGERMDILVETVLGRDPVWPRLLDQARRDLRQAEQEIARIDGRLEGQTAETLAGERAELAETLDRLMSDNVVAQRSLATAEEQRERTQDAWQAAQQQAGERATVEARVLAAEAAHTARTQLYEEALRAAAAAAADVKAELDALPAYDIPALEAREQENALALQRHRDALRERDEALRLREMRATERATLAAQIGDVERKRDALDEKIEHLDGGYVDTCPTCEQELRAEARATTIRSLQAQAQEATDTARALVEQERAIVLPDIPSEPALLALDDVTAELRQAREADLTRARLLERLRSLSDTIQAASSGDYLEELQRLGEARQDAEDALAALPPPADLPALERAAGRARAAVEQHRATLAAVQQQQAVAQERLAQHEQREIRFREDIAASQLAHQQLYLLKHLERAYNRDGIPALLIENVAIPKIEEETAHILNLLGGPVQRVELRTETAKKDGTGTKPALDIVCHIDGGERSYRMLSGGEQFRVDLALRRGLAAAAGADIDLLVIDEPDGLDASGKQALIGILQDFEQAGIFTRLLLISHDSDLRDSFETVLEVVKENDRSTIVGNREAVAA